MKNIMKNLTLALLALSFTFSLAACASCKKTPNGSSTDSSAESSSDSSVDSSSVGSDVTDEDLLGDDWVLVTEPTCTEDGEKKRVDPNDPTKEETAAIPARGHEYSETTGTCIRCDAEATIPALGEGESCITLTTCTHSDSDVAEGYCDCTYKGRGEEYNRVELTEGCYTVTVGASQELWLSFSAKQAGQYVLYTVDEVQNVKLARYNANFAVVPKPGIDAIAKDGRLYSYVNCGTSFYNSEWRATYCIKAAPDTTVNIRFVRIDEPAWEPISVYTNIYPTQINGVKAPEAPEGKTYSEVDYIVDYYYSDPANGGDGYYHINQGNTATDPVIYVAIDQTAPRMFSEDKFTTVLNNIGSALNLGNGLTADGNYNIYCYRPFIMNWKDDNAAVGTRPGSDSTELEIDPEKNCYQNFVNSDGLYPVNQELFKFLNLYVRANKPIDENVTQEDWNAEQELPLDSLENKLWLAACYYYSNQEVGTEYNPKAVGAGEYTFDLPSLDFYYCQIKNAGTYTITCTAQNISLGINDERIDNFTTITVTVTDKPITFDLSTIDGSPLTGVTVKIEKTA